MTPSGDGRGYLPDSGDLIWTEFDPARGFPRDRIAAVAYVVLHCSEW
jgi:hypothetical protein